MNYNAGSFDVNCNREKIAIARQCATNSKDLFGNNNAREYQFLCLPDSLLKDLLGRQWAAIFSGVNIFFGVLLCEVDDVPIISSSHIKMKLYQPELLAKLSTVEDASAQLKLSGGAVERLRNLIKDYGFDKIIGIAMLHKHFDLQVTEAMVERATGDKFVSQPEVFDRDEAGIVPAILSITDDYEFLPLEYMKVEEDQASDMLAKLKVVSANTEFMKGFKNVVKSYHPSLSGLMGVFVLKETIPDGFVFVEREETERRKLTTTLVPVSSFEDETGSVIETMWTAYGPLQRGCFSICVSVGNAHGGKHW